MKQFVFDSKQKRFFIAMMAVGLLCLVWSWFAEPAVIAEAGVHQRFWTNFLHNAAFFTGIAFMITFVIAAFTLAYSGWHVVFKRVWEAFSLFLLPGLVLMAIIGIGNYAHLHHLYHWAAEGVTTVGSETYDKIIAGKSAFLNNGWYLFGTLLLGGFWAFVATRMRKISVEEDEHGDRKTNFTFQSRLRKWSAIFLPFAAFTGPAMIWQWIMSIDAHWYSTLFAWYSMASWWLAGCALTIILLLYLQGKGYFEEVTKEHLHDLAKYMFAFSIFWTYCWFSQYMLIWYGNIGEETIYFKERVDHYSVLFFGNLVINFVLPFLILLPNTTKRRYGTLMFTAGLVFIGHWIDYFYMIKPGTLITAKELSGEHGHEVIGEHGHEAAHGAAAHASNFVEGFTIPGLLELGILIGFLGLFLYFVFTRLSKASLVPVNDPYMDESLHHEVQLYE
ncbi:MAG TPA: hypothetical protein ENJ20_00560 [Bacteroidetes bacterium]|nr:hypothetical protein [Bacteroidota bacterium]